MNAKLELGVRRGRHADLNFVFDTWINSFRKASEFSRKIHRKVYEHDHRRLVQRCLARPTTVIWIAHAKDNEDVIYGYIVVEGGFDREVVHYLYVKGTWQRMGVATFLIGHALQHPERIYMSHYTFNRRNRDGTVNRAGAEIFCERYPMARDHGLDKHEAVPLESIDGNLYRPYLM